MKHRVFLGYLFLLISCVVYTRQAVYNCHCFSALYREIVISQSLAILCLYAAWQFLWIFRSQKTSLRPGTDFSGRCSNRLAVTSFSVTMAKHAAPGVRQSFTARPREVGDFALQCGKKQEILK